MIITVSGVSVAGSSLYLLCTATPPIKLVTLPIVSWVDVVEADDVTVANSLTVSNSSATVTFTPLRTSHGRVYVCVTGYNIPDADLPDLTNTASIIVRVQSRSLSHSNVSYY